MKNQLKLRQLLIKYDRFYFTLINHVTPLNWLDFGQAKASYIGNGKSVRNVGIWTYDQGIPKFGYQKGNLGRNESTWCSLDSFNTFPLSSIVI